MSFWETYNEVAEFLDGVRMNYDATQRAIREWQLSRELLKLSAQFLASPFELSEGLVIYQKLWEISNVQHFKCSNLLMYETYTLRMLKTKNAYIIILSVEKLNITKGENAE